jgi:hypothetical protein
MSVIVLEFNELSPVLVEKFMLAGKLPNFRRLYDESEVSLTEADAPAPKLEPWIQWVTVHSGIPFAEHGIEHLADGHTLKVPSVWDLASDAGKSVWVCGSMNVKYDLPINGWVLPDPWSTRVLPHPEEVLRPYYRFVSASVQEHTRGDAALSRSEQKDFLTFMARNGLRPATVAALVRQLTSERFGDTRWKRPALLDRIQFDLFRSHWKRARPDFSTLFLNSTAHYQHRYWRNMEPEHFEVKPESGEQAVYQDAILYGYQQMDRLCGQLLDLAGDDTTLVLVTALSQQPCLDYEDIGGKAMYRPLDLGLLLRSVGVTEPAQVVPVMAEEFQYEFETEDAARKAEERLRRLRYEGREAIAVKRQGAELKCGCQVHTQVAEGAQLELADSGEQVPFYDLFYSLDLLKSGSHHPDGLLWVRTPERRRRVHREKVPLTEVAPTLLELLGVSPPVQMTEREPVAV